MKLIIEKKYNSYTEYFYENETIKRVWNDGEFFWIKNKRYHKEDGAALRNCADYCANHNSYHRFNNVYNRHFVLNNCFIDPTSFAMQTNHIVCVFCEDFCNQQCFLRRKFS